MAGAEQRPEIPGSQVGPDAPDSEQRKRPTIKITRLKAGFTHAQLRALGQGNEVMGAVRYLEEIGRLLDAGEITEDTRPLGEELDRLGPGTIASSGDKSIN